MSEERKLNIKAILIGLAVDIGGTFIASIFMGIIAGVIMASKGVDPEQIGQELTASKQLLSISLFVGFSFTFLGGYVAAFIAKTDELKHALGVGILSLIVSLILSAGMISEDSSWLVISLFILPFAVLGGYLRQITKKQAKPKHPPA